MAGLHPTRPGLRHEGSSTLLNKPTTQDWKRVKHLVRYLQGTQRYNFSVHPTAQLSTELKEIDIDAFVDADWAGDPVTRKSTSGFAIYILGTCVHFGSRTQQTVALSSAESELYAIGTGAIEALHLRNFLKELHSNLKINIRIHTDSSACKSIATRIGSSKKAKHIAIKHLFIQQLVQANIVTIVKVRSDDNRADVFTKHVTPETLRRHLHAIGLVARGSNNTTQ